MAFNYGQLPIFDSAEVVVVGSGSAGSVAAIAIARTGADTLLIERYGFLAIRSEGVEKGAKSGKPSK